MRKIVAPIGMLVGAAVWFLLFVIIGVPLGTSFIAGGCAAAACVLAGAMALVDAPLTSAGLLLGIATFAILEVVLSVPLWVDVISGLGVMGLYDTVDAAIRRGRLAAPTADRQERRRPFAPTDKRAGRNGHEREPVGAR